MVYEMNFLSHSLVTYLTCLLIPFNTCSANQWTGFYMITASVMKELTYFHSSYICSNVQNFLLRIWMESDSNLNETNFLVTVYRRHHHMNKLLIFWKISNWKLLFFIAWSNLFVHKPTRSTNVLFILRISPHADESAGI